jgi:hypothetical protein
MEGFFVGGEGPEGLGGAQLGPNLEESVAKPGGPTHVSPGAFSASRPTSTLRQLPAIVRIHLCNGPLHKCLAGSYVVAGPASS